MIASKLWGNSFLAKRTAKGLVRIGIIVPVTVGDMDADVELIGVLLFKSKDDVALGKQWQLMRNTCNSTVLLGAKLP